MKFNSDFYFAYNKGAKDMINQLKHNIRFSKDILETKNKL